MKTAFLFSGQGAQYIGMGKELYDNFPEAKAVFDEVQVDFDVKSTCFEGPMETLNDTAYAQACIFTMSMAAAAVLKAQGIPCDGCAGLSLGEYSAYAYGESFTIKDGAQIVRERGKLMAHSLPQGTSGMAAILMLDEENIKKACTLAQDAKLGVCEIANYNCPGQIVITGSSKAVAFAQEKCKELGARKVIPLTVSGAFHSSLLKEASNVLKDELHRYDMKQANLPIYNNITGTMVQGDIVDILTKQICSSVYFEQTIQAMLADGYTTFIEVGPGSAVSSFVKKCAKGHDVQVYHIEDMASLKQLTEGMENN